jgi:hypothetical protein
MVGVHTPSSPARADFSIMIECTPETAIAILCVLCGGDKFNQGFVVNLDSDSGQIFDEQILEIFFSNTAIFSQTSMKEFQGIDEASNHQGRTFSSNIKFLTFSFLWVILPSCVRSQSPYQQHSF